MARLFTMGLLFTANKQKNAVVEDRLHGKDHSIRLSGYNYDPDYVDSSTDSCSSSSSDEEEVDESESESEASTSSLTSNSEDDCFVGHQSWRKNIRRKKHTHEPLTKRERILQYNLNRAMGRSASFYGSDINPARNYSPLKYWRLQREMRRKRLENNNVLKNRTKVTATHSYKQSIRVSPIARKEAESSNSEEEAPCPRLMVETIFTKQIGDDEVILSNETSTAIDSKTFHEQENRITDISKQQSVALPVAALASALTNITDTLVSSLNCVPEEQKSVTLSVAALTSTLTNTTDTLVSSLKCISEEYGKHTSHLNMHSDGHASSVGTTTQSNAAVILSQDKPNSNSTSSIHLSKDTYMPMQNGGSSDGINTEAKGNLINATFTEDSSRQGYSTENKENDRDDEINCSNLNKQLSAELSVKIDVHSDRIFDSSNSSVVVANQLSTMPAPNTSSRDQTQENDEREINSFKKVHSATIYGQLNGKYVEFIIPHCLLWIYTILLTVGVYSSNQEVLYYSHLNQYDDQIPKKWRFIRLNNNNNNNA